MEKTSWTSVLFHYQVFVENLFSEFQLRLSQYDLSRSNNVANVPRTMDTDVQLFGFS